MRRLRVRKVTRIGFVSTVILTLLAACILRLGWLQVVRGPELASAAEAARTTTTTIPAKRGDILDANGRVLATSIETYNIYAQREYINTHAITARFRGETQLDKDAEPEKGDVVRIIAQGPAEVARELAPILEADAAELAGTLYGESGSVIIATHVSVEKWREVQALNIPGIDGVKTYSRLYPNGTTASTVLGFTALAGDGEPTAPLEGKAGIELTQDKVLTGTDGTRSVEISPSGQVIPGGYSQVQAAKDGDSVKLTLNADLQSLAQTELNDVVSSSGAEWGSVIVEDVKTGAILTLADSGSLTPDEIREGKGETTGSRAVQYTYEPGSTGKLVTFATGLSEGAFGPLTPVNVPYEVTMPDGQSFRDSHTHPTLSLTAAGVLAESSNTGTVQLGDLVGDRQRWEMMKKLGLGEKTGIEMPGETAGVIGSPDDWDGRQRYTTMFGQGMSTSPLQVTSLVATIANGGVREPVHIIDSTVSAAGAETKAEHSAPEAVLDPDTASTLLKMMESVTTDEGTAKAAAVPGYTTAGKTGTTEILSPSGKSEGVVSSFVGALPAEDPRVAISVVVYKPKGANIYGGTLAGPVFSKIASAAMAQLDVPPSEGTRTLYPLSPG